jgi:hypothetical protein
MPRSKRSKRGSRWSTKPQKLLMTERSSMKQTLQTESENGHRSAFETAAAVEFRWVRLVSFDAAEKLFSLRMLANSARRVRFMRFFGHRILGGPTRGERTQREDTKEEEDTKTRRIISARGARKCASSLCPWCLGG